MASAKENTGVDKVWEQVMKFKEVQSKNGGLEEKRRRQGKYWMWKQVQEIIRLKTERDDDLKERANMLDRALMEVRTIVMMMLLLLRRLKAPFPNLSLPNYLSFRPHALHRARLRLG